MKATISSIADQEELNEALEVIKSCNGTVLSSEPVGKRIVITAEFDTSDDRDEVDVLLCDLGFDVEWEEEETVNQQEGLLKTYHVVVEVNSRFDDVFSVKEVKALTAKEALIGYLNIAEDLEEGETVESCLKTLGTLSMRDDGDGGYFVEEERTIGVGLTRAIACEMYVQARIDYQG